MIAGHSWVVFVMRVRFREVLGGATRLNVARQLLLTLVLFFGPVHHGLAKDINFGWPSGEGWSSQPYKAAIEKGFFEKEGLKIRMITFRGTNLMLARK